MLVGVAVNHNRAKCTALCLKAQCPAATKYIGMIQAFRVAHDVARWRHVETLVGVA